MTVVHIAFNYGLNNTGGAAIASTRLHLALLSSGVESHYVCIHKREEGPNVHQLPNGWRRLLFFALTKISRCMWKFTPYRRSVSLNIIPLLSLERLLEQIKPDVVHCHWLNGDVMSFGQLARLAKVLPAVRVVVNLHDLFMINAEEPYPGQDRRYIDGFGKVNSTWLERWLWGRKKRIFQSLSDRICFIGPSNWVIDCARKSVVGRDVPACAVSNLIDFRFRYNCHLYAKKDVFVILFGANFGRANTLKGFDDLARALALIPDEMKAHMQLQVFGEMAPECVTGGVPTKFLGPINDVESLVTIYHRADVFAFPSRQETQGMTKIEALLCGLPVVAFDRTACAEGLDDGVTGWIAHDGRVDEFSKGLQKAFEGWRAGWLGTMRRMCADSACRRFAREKILESVLLAYNGVSEVDLR